MRHALIASFILVLAPAAFAQSLSMDVNPSGGRITVTVPELEMETPTTISVHEEELSGDGFSVHYVPSQDGGSRLEVVEPAGAYLTAFSGKRRIAEDDVPTSFSARPGTWIRLVLTLADGAVFERKIQVREGMTGTVRVHGFATPTGRVRVVAAPAPAFLGMSGVDFERLRAAIEAESFSAQKLDVLRTAMRGTGLTCSQAGELVDLFDFSRDKVESVRIMRDHLVDPQNAFTLYERFTFSHDKEQVKQILSAR